jgi:metallophosphoesterase superfamily enzyme
VGLTRSVVDAVASWSDQLSAEILVIEGNHDRKLRQFPDAWNLRTQTGTLEAEPFSLQHDPAVEARGYALAGHLHPTVDLREGGDRLRLPCFRFDEGVGVLPAFTPFSNGVRQEVRPGRRLFAVTEGAVIDLNAER